MLSLQKKILAFGEKYLLASLFSSCKPFYVSFSCYRILTAERRHRAIVMQLFFTLYHSKRSFSYLVTLEVLMHPVAKKLMS
jgi:hypothetical protein